MLPRMNKSVHYLNTGLVIKRWMSILTLINTIFASIVSLCIIFYVLTIYLSKRDARKSFHVSLILTCNTCLTIICSCIIFGLMALSSLAGDCNYASLQWIISWNCYFRGYLVNVFLTSIYLSYIIQAAYRLLRIVYHKHKYLRRMSTFSYYIVMQWALAFIVSLPMLIRSKTYSSMIIYLPDNFNCVVPFTNICATTYSVISVYLSPLFGLCFIYFRIIIHLKSERRRRPSIPLKFRRQNKRDKSVITRIYLVIFVLCGLGLPTIIFYLLYVLTDQLHWTTYRLSFLSISISFVFISLSSLYVTPQIYKRIRTICSCSRSAKKNSCLSYSISINIEREKKMESILLENTTIADPNLLSLFQ